MLKRKSPASPELAEQMRREGPLLTRDEFAARFGYAKTSCYKQAERLSFRFKPTPRSRGPYSKRNKPKSRLPVPAPLHPTGSTAAADAVVGFTWRGVTVCGTGASSAAINCLAGFCASLEAFASVPS